MNLENQNNLKWQVSNLELSKKLAKYLKRASLFYWKQDEGEPYIVMRGTRYMGSKGTILANAFTATELGKMLPEGFFCAKGKKWRGWFSNTENPFDWFDSEEFDPIDYDNEASLRAKMLIYLIENKLINL